MQSTIWLEIEGEKVGYAKYSIKSSEDTVFIEYIYVYRQYRQRGYGKQIFELLVGQFPDHNFELLAKEDMERYGRLFDLYQSWGFQQVGKISYFSDNDNTYRKCLFRKGSILI